MFTGIIEDKGTITAAEHKGQTLCLQVASRLAPDSVRPGDSVGINGVCLTVTSWLQDAMRFDVSHESIATTALKFCRKGDRVNLERALTLAGRLGGHLVTGHVDCVGEVLARASRGENLDLTILAPEPVSALLVPKGSVAVDGVSLTVNEPEGGKFQVTLVPHTLAETTLGDRRTGDPVNLEADILGKYVRHFVGGRDQGGLDREFLIQHGFLTPEDSS